MNSSSLKRGHKSSPSEHLALLAGGALALALALACLQVANCQERLTVDQRDPKAASDDSSLADTINYLENVDKVLSQLSRPRFGRSEYKQRGQQPPVGMALLQGASSNGPTVAYNPILIEALRGRLMAQRMAAVATGANQAAVSY